MDLGLLLFLSITGLALAFGVWAASTNDQKVAEEIRRMEDHK